MLRNGGDPRSFTPLTEIAQCLTSAEHCMGLMCYDRYNRGLEQEAVLKHYRRPAPPF